MTESVIQKDNLKYDLGILKDKKFDNVSIICHDQPDPDALASSMAIQNIISSMGLKGTIYYGGEIAHTQNRVMVNVFNIPIIKLDPEDDDTTKKSIKESISNSYIVLIDTSHFGEENCVYIKQFVEDKKVDLIIDHHSINPNVSCEYIHRPYGSCSSILVEIMSELKIPMSKQLATALYLGISKDTDDLKTEGTTENDIKACETIKPFIDLETYLKILNYKKPKALLGLRQIAYNALDHDTNLITTNVGMISPQQRALLADICEELLSIEGIETTIVVAIVNEGDGKKKYLESSFRSSALAMDANEFVQSVFGKKYSGGRKGSAGAKVPFEKSICDIIDFCNNKDSGESLECFIDRIFETYKSKIRKQKDKM